MSAGESRELRFAIDHPCAAGHFPNNPIVPGALLLDTVLEALSLSGPIVIRRVKFLRITRPGMPLHLVWQTMIEGQIQFTCHSDNDVIMTGLIESK